MSYTLFAGCSYTAGTGFDAGKHEAMLWTNQLHRKFFSDTQCLNIGHGGRSNAGIFQDTIWQLLHQPIRYAVVQWTSMPRYNLELGFELYDTYQALLPNNQCKDHKLNDVTYSAVYLNSIQDRLVTLSHDCYEIANLVQYVNVILKSAKLTNTQVFFVNGICPWDLDFFTIKNSVLPDQYTPYTQKILNTNNRDDQEIFALYRKMHQKFHTLGGIQPAHWLNLYNSMHHSQIDYNNDGLHPGYNSNNLYFDFLSSSLESKLI